MIYHSICCKFLRFINFVNKKKILKVSGKNFFWNVDKLSIIYDIEVFVGGGFYSGEGVLCVCLCSRDMCPQQHQ